jgi:hypothetical protein
MLGKRPLGGMNLLMTFVSELEKVYTSRSGFQNYLARIFYSRGHHPDTLGSSFRF